MRPFRARATPWATVRCRRVSRQATLALLFGFASFTLQVTLVLTPFFFTLQVTLAFLPAGPLGPAWPAAPARPAGPAGPGGPTTGAAAIPFRAVTGFSGALVSAVRFAEAYPGACGAKRTCRCRWSPARSSGDRCRSR